MSNNGKYFRILNYMYNINQPVNIIQSAAVNEYLL